MTVDKDLLLKADLEEDLVDVPGKGEVRVRALSRAEVFRIKKLEDKGEQRMERAILSAAMIEPQLTESEVGDWQESSAAGVIDPVLNRVMEMSGMLEGAAKEAYKEFEQDPDAEFRVLASGEAGDDGGPDAGRDASG